ncbi:MAG: glycyl-radical enzyme activating protein [Firmicutes bacterium]|nr:glycyl-radical enzyme activating protein [Bacillota bacterium]
MMNKGIIFNIQRFSLHDGPGIRTTIFFKGCPLSCPWCQNPEGMRPEKDLFRHSARCIACRFCVEHCPEKAVELTENGPVINRDLCSLCLICAENCPVEAFEKAGREITVGELVNEIIKDRIIFEESGGGATFSGGEPLMQSGFLISVLKALKNEGIHTAIETSGYASWESFRDTLPYTDLYLFDLKIVDPGKCKEFLGVNIEPILENLNKLAKNNADILVRIPVIPSVNDDLRNLNLVVKTLNSAGIDSLELIPYHKLGSAKYSNLDLNYSMHNIEPPGPDQLDRITKLLEASGIIIHSEVEREND